MTFSHPHTRLNHACISPSRDKAYVHSIHASSHTVTGTYCTNIEGQTRRKFKFCMRKCVLENVPPDNRPRPVLKLADFGLARQLHGSLTHISADGGWGTLKYMAPEVVHQPSRNFRFRDVVDVVLGRECGWISSIISFPNVSMPHVDFLRSITYTDVMRSLAGLFLKSVGESV